MWPVPDAQSQQRPVLVHALGVAVTVKACHPTFSALAPQAVHRHPARIRYDTVAGPVAAAAKAMRRRVSPVPRASARPSLVPVLGRLGSRRRAFVANSPRHCGSRRLGRHCAKTAHTTGSMHSAHFKQCLRLMLLSVDALRACMCLYFESHGANSYLDSSALPQSR